MTNIYKSIRYATARELPTAIEVKKQNIERELRRKTGIKVKVSLKQVQRYLAEELKKPTLTFDLSLWNRVNR